MYSKWYMVYKESDSRAIDKSFSTVKIKDENDHEILFAFRELLNSSISFDSGVRTMNEMNMCQTGQIDCS